MRSSHGCGKHWCVLLAGWIVLTSCGGTSGPDCQNETRSLGVTAKLTSFVPGAQPTDTGSAHLSLHEARNFETKATAERGLTWFVGSGLARTGVTAVHVHEQGTDRLLFEIPIGPLDGPAFVIAQVFTRRPYTGSVDWAEVYQLIGTEKTYVDVHTNQHPNGQLRGTLRPENANWTAFTHAFCS